MYSVTKAIKRLAALNPPMTTKIVNRNGHYTVGDSNTVQTVDGSENTVSIAGSGGRVSNWLWQFSGTVYYTNLAITAVLLALLFQPTGGLASGESGSLIGRFFAALWALWR